MKSKTYILITQITLYGFCGLVVSQSAEVPDVSWRVTGNSTEVEHPASYYQPLGPGLISASDVEIFQGVNSRGSARLAGLDNGAGCKQSTWVPKLQMWLAAASHAADVKTHAAVLDLIPTMADFLDGSIGEVSYDLCPELVKMKSEMFISSPIVIRSIAAYIEEKSGNAEPERLAAFVRVFSVEGLVREENYTETPVPVGESGVMILDAAAVTSQLKAMPWKRASEFIGDVTATQAFSRYEASGNGLAVLKTKYAANKDVIIAKWNELIAWVAQQRAANP